MTYDQNSTPIDITLAAEPVPITVGDTIQHPELDTAELKLLAGDNMVKSHAAGIKAAWEDTWQKVIPGIIETGQRLINAKSDMRGKYKGQWLRLFDPLVGKLPFKEDKAERLMAIAKNTFLTDSAHERNLPPSWTTLYVLSGATPKQLEKWLAAGDVHAEMERKDAEELVKPKAKAKDAEELVKKPKFKTITLLPPTADDEDVDPDNDPTLPDDDAEQRWQRSLGNIAGDAVALRAYWTKEFGDWEKFEVPSEFVTLVKQAANAWMELAADLTKSSANAAKPISKLN
jgi:hypothetical protein